MTKQQETATVTVNRPMGGLYHRLDLAAPGIARTAGPGQFVHLQLPLFQHRVLRRPFSICDADPESGRLSIVYKIVGEGTAHLARLPAGTTADLLGPLGVGFSPPPAGRQPIVVAGGYGCAATYLLAKRAPQPCLCLFGARSAGDLLMEEEFRALGCELRTATDDGSAGHRGLVTELLAAALDAVPAGGAPPMIYACGPNPMLRAVSRLVLARGWDAEISLDHAMCCGVGACFACVVKRRAANADGWEYARTCVDGPVFRASDAVWDVP